MGSPHEALSDQSYVDRWHDVLLSDVLFLATEDGYRTIWKYWQGAAGKKIALSGNRLLVGVGCLCDVVRQ
jgi:hypothetical protein